MTLPVSGASQNRKISEIRLSEDYRWRDKMLRTIDNCYRYSPHFGEGWPLVEKIIQTDFEDLAAKLGFAIRLLSDYLELKTGFVSSSDIAIAGGGSAEDRIVEILHRIGATTYTNLPGGRTLYSPDRFAREGIRLRFVRDVFQDAADLGGIARDDLSFSILHLIMKYNRKVIADAIEAIPLEP